MPEAPPIMLLGPSTCPDRLLTALQELAPGHVFEGEGPDETWEVTVAFPKRGLFGKATRVIVAHRPDYYLGESWPKQRDGLARFFSQGNPDPERLGRITALTSHLAFGVSVRGEPGFGDDDPRVDLVLDLVRCIDGVLFLAGGLYDAEFRCLMQVGGEFDPEAEFPTWAVPGSTAEGATTEAAPGKPEPGEAEPPDADRVARRLLVLAALAARATTELQFLNGHPELADQVPRIRGWVRDLGLDDELEDRECGVLEAPAGELDEGDLVDHCWRTEGAAMLAWALGLHELGRYDQATRTTDLLTELAFPDREQAEALLADAALRPEAELETMREQQLAFHWRVREFGLRPEVVDFRDFGKTCGFGPVDLSWAEFGPDGDLALKGDSLAEAGNEAVSLATSIAMERHLAINWLRGGSLLYSATDTST